MSIGICKGRCTHCGHVGPALVLEIISPNRFILCEMCVNRLRDTLAIRLEDLKDPENR